MIVGISGLAGSGKDTLADILVREHRFVKVSFADPLKRICADIFGFSYDQLWGPSAARNAPDERYPRGHGPWTDGKCVCCNLDVAGQTPGGAVELFKSTQCYLTPRFALQKLGTEWGRTCYPNVWVDYAIRVAEVLSDGHHVYDPSHRCNTIYKITKEAPLSVVIPDVRYKNEIDGLRAYGAKLIRVVRTSAGLVGAAGAHTSETEQAEISDGFFDTVIWNDGTIAELGKLAAEAITDVLK